VKIRLLAFLAGVLLSVSPGWGQQTIGVTSSGGSGGKGTFSNGDVWPVSRAFFFEVGVFKSGFDPAIEPKSAWASAWIPLSTDEPDALNSWFSDAGVTYFSVTGSSTQTAGLNAGSRLYVWGYNTKSLASAPEWILLTNPAWQLQTPVLPQVSLFDTSDAGTVTILGILANGGRDLVSAPATSGFDIRFATGDVIVAAGGVATLRVDAVGEGLVYQWYEGQRGDTSKPLSGQAKAVLSLSSVQGARSFWARVTSGARSLDSRTMTVTGSTLGSQISAKQDVGSFGYIPGGRVVINVGAELTAAFSQLNISVLLPADWSYLSDNAQSVAQRPVAGDTGVLEWTWSASAVPSPSFSFVVAVPASTSGKPSVTTMVSGLRDGVTHQVLAQSDPLLVPAGPSYHSADTDRNSRISLLELTRVIELYGTRSLQVRTGAYRPDALGEDGFAPDVNRASGVTAVPTTPHTADFNRDGRISLLELTRVIELYNQRSGFVRTGEYFARGDTEDGFVPGSK